jgi:uncharacterized membrane protein
MTALPCRRSNERPAKRAPASGRMTPVIAVLGLMALGASGCGDGPTTTELPPPPKVTVSATEPARAEQGETLEVRILGEGFVDDAVVSWRRNGAADPLIVVEQVTFVSATELIASILVGADADVAEYDVVVRSQRISGEGLGARLFEVSSYTPISVLSTHPAEGKQGRTVDIRILGTGFLNDAVPTWERDGVADTLIVVDHVMFVSETELRATVKIDRETDLGSYDVAVRSKRKKGIGSEEPTGVGQDIFTVQPYEPQALGWVGTTMPFASVFGINDEGVVVGAGVSPHRATFWTVGGSATAFGSEPSRAYGINNHGYIAGTRSKTPHCGAYCHYEGFVYHVESGFKDLRPMGDEGTTEALAINDAGTVVGRAASGTDYQALGPWRPVVWRLDANGGYSEPIELGMNRNMPVGMATGVNSRGDIVGTVSYSGLNSSVGVRAALWRVRDDGSYAGPIMLGGSGGSMANGINDDGWIVGATSDTGATLWLPGDYGTPVPVGVETAVRLASEALAISNDGAVVGWMRADSSGSTSLMCCEYWGEGMLWQLDESGAAVHTVALVGTSGHDRSTARAVNRHGWVVGYSWRGGEGFSYREATLWRPDR